MQHIETEFTCSLEHDTNLTEKNNTRNTVLELNKYVDIDTITNYTGIDVSKGMDFFVKSS
jgi:hypothetical protein